MMYCHPLSSDILLRMLWGAGMAQWWDHFAPQPTWLRFDSSASISGLSLLSVLVLALRGFSPGTKDFPSPQKPTFSNCNSTLYFPATNEKKKKKMQWNSEYTAPLPPTKTVNRTNYFWYFVFFFSTSVQCTGHLDKLEVKYTVLYG